VNVVVLAGYSGAGKTTLLEKLLPALKARGRRVSVVKHAHHRFEIDHPGKDTWRHREAGAFEVVAAAPHQLVLQRQFEQTVELSVHHALAELYAGVDWVLVEGFRDCDLPKLEVWRPASGQPVRYPHDPFVAAICTDAQPCSAAALPSATGLPVLNLNDGAAVADWLLAQGDRFAYDAERHAV
jgi:molybdopterin-guanine dinucleotide biosynthesis protein B